MGQRLEVREMRAGYRLVMKIRWSNKKTILEQSGPETAKVRVLRVVDFRIAPRVDTSTDELAIDLNFLLGANDRKGEEVL